MEGLTLCSRAGEVFEPFYCCKMYVFKKRILVSRYDRKRMVSVQKSVQYYVTLFICVKGKLAIECGHGSTRIAKPLSPAV
jgi:hypothetical protein